MDTEFGERRESPRRSGRLGLPRKEKSGRIRRLPVIMLIDTSGSMKGQAIGAINMAIRDLLRVELPNLKGDKEFKIGVAIMAFDNKANWVTGDPEFIYPDSNCEWDNLDPDGATSLGDAFAKLENILNRIFSKDENDKEFYCKAGYFAPVIILFTDGAATDDYKTNLNRLQSMSKFKKAIKAAVGYDNECGDKYDKDMLLEFTGDAKKILEAKDVKQLKESIIAVTLRASEEASNPAP